MYVEPSILWKIYINFRLNKLGGTWEKVDNSNKKIILYGAGDIGKKWLEKLGSKKVYAFSDSNEELFGKSINGKRVLSHNELIREKKEILLFPAVRFELVEDIVNSIKKIGLAECITFSPCLSDIRALYGSYCGYDVEYGGKNYFGENAFISNSQIGFGSYLSDRTKLSNVKIGKYTAIGPDVGLIIGKHPSHGFVSIHPAFYSISGIVQPQYVEEQFFNEHSYTEEGRTVSIGNDVWIGAGARIMEGIYIADGTIVAAGAIVTKDTEPYSIVAGIPAKIISYRFKRDDIDFLLALKWWERSEDWIRHNAKYFCDISIFRQKLVQS